MLIKALHKTMVDLQCDIIRSIVGIRHIRTWYNTVCPNFSSYATNLQINIWTKTWLFSCNSVKNKLLTIHRWKSKPTIFTIIHAFLFGSRSPNQKLYVEFTIHSFYWFNESVTTVVGLYFGTSTLSCLINGGSIYYTTFLVLRSLVVEI